MFFLVSIGRIAPQNIISLYTYILQMPKALDITLGLGAMYSLLGLIFLISAFRCKEPQQFIQIEEQGHLLRIPVDTFKDFIEQILQQNPYVSDYDTSVSFKRLRVAVTIVFSFNQSLPVRQEVGRIRAALKEEIEHVFGFTHVTINCQMKDIKVNHKKTKEKEDLVKDGEHLTASTIFTDHILTDDGDASVSHDDKIDEENSADKRAIKKKFWRL